MIDLQVLAELDRRMADHLRAVVQDCAEVIEIRTFPMADGSLRWATSVYLWTELEAAA